MYYYFSAEYTSAIKINGIFKSKLNSGQQPFVITDKEISNCSSQILIELCPLNGNELPITFMLDQDFLTSPPNSVIVVDLKGGYYIKFLSLCRLAPFQIIAQQKLSYAIITIFKENGLKLSIETPNDFFAENLSFDCQDAKITPFALNNKQFIAITFQTPKTKCFCYLLDNKITKVFCRDIESFCTDNGFSTTELFEDIAGHKIVCDWAFLDGSIKVVNKKISYQKDFCLDILPSEFVGYAFLEEFLVGGEIKDFLCEQMQDKAKYLKDFFLDYIGVCPPPSFRDYDEVALIYKKTQNTYYLNYYKFEIENKRITNVKRLDN